MTRPDRSDQTAFTHANREALHRAVLAAQRHPRLSQHEGYDRDARLRRYRWWIEEVVGDDVQVVASGRALTRRAATRRKHRAYLRELNR